MAAARPRNLPTRCAIYTRQSVVRPGGDPAVASCALQRENCLHFVRARSRHGWHALDEHFDDEGHSGATVERPALERLFARIRAGEVDRVVVYRLDRLTRRVVDWALLARLLEHYRVGLTVVAGSIDIDGGAIARMQLNTLAIFSELERELIGARLTAKSAKKASGYYRCRTAGCPTGQVAAAAIEEKVLASLRAPDPRWTSAVRARLGELAAAWELMWLVNRRRALAEYFERIAWRARTAEVVLDPAPLDAASGRGAAGP